MRTLLIVVFFVFLTISCGKGGVNNLKEEDENLKESTKSKDYKISWEKTFGGDQNDGASSIISTTDGYLLAGFTEPSANNRNAWVIKLDKSGDKTWEKTFGGSQDDKANSIISTTDGYLLAGFTEPKDKDNLDAWVIKLDKSGNKLWEKTFGGDQDDGASSIISTPDGYLLAGFTEPKGADNRNAWVIKLDKKGNQTWEKTFGGDQDDETFSIISAPDGYLLAGYTKSVQSASYADAWVIKLDKSGNKLWEKTFGGSQNDEILSIVSTLDGYLLAGFTETKDEGKMDAWVIKLDKSGRKVWEKTFGGSQNGEALSIVSTSDGYLLAGFTEPKDRNNLDAWVIKLDKSGRKVWEKTFGGSQNDEALSIVSTPDGYLLAGYTESKGAGKRDAWVIKLDKNGN